MNDNRMVALQQAVFGVLSGDGTLGAMISGVYDRVPEGTVLPYVVFGPVSAQDAAHTTRQAERMTMELRVYSRQAGRRELLDITARVYDLLHHQPPAISDESRVVWLRVETVNATLLKDGMTWEGRLLARALVEPTV